MNARRFAAAVAAGVVLWAIGILAVLWAVEALTPDVSSGKGVEVRIEEDDPRWDCRTMGNQHCGEGRAA